MSTTSPVPDHSHLDRVGYSFGFPIAHSMSPLMHKTIFDTRGWNWQQMFLPSTDISHFLKLTEDEKFFGISRIASKLLDEITPECQAVGACNTFYLRTDSNGKRRRSGTNTDVIGIREAFFQNVPNAETVYHGRPALVVGGGGAARSAVYASKKFMKCETVYLVNRDKAEVDAVISWCESQGYGEGLVHVVSAEQAERSEGTGAIVSCIPDFEPSTEGEIAARKTLEAFLAKPHKGALLEMAYHPVPWTRIAEISQKEGWQVILGTEAMIYQGLEQSRYWTGQPVSETEKAKVKEVIAEQSRKSQL